MGHADGRVGGRRWFRPVLLGVVALLVVLSVGVVAFGPDGEHHHASEAAGGNQRSAPSQQRRRLGIPSFLRRGVPAAKAPALRPGELFDSEPRHGWWAPRMEKQLRSWLDDMDRTDFPGFAVSSVECRETTCRVVFEFPSEQRARTVDHGMHRPTSPPVLASHYVGPLAHGSSLREHEARHFTRDGQRWETEVYLLQFGDEDIDPDQYGAWRRRKLEEFWMRIWEKDPKARVKNPIPVSPPGR